MHWASAPRRATQLKHQLLYGMWGNSRLVGSTAPSSFGVAVGTFASASSLATSIVSSTDDSSVRSFDVATASLRSTVATLLVPFSPFCQTNMLQIQIAARRLHHVTWSHEASVWTYHQSFHVSATRRSPPTASSRPQPQSSPTTITVLVRNQLLTSAI